MLTPRQWLQYSVGQPKGLFYRLVHGGWKKGRALLYNLFSALTFLTGGLFAYAASFTADVTFLQCIDDPLPGAAGYIESNGALPSPRPLCSSVGSCVIALATVDSSLQKALDRLLRCVPAHPATSCTKPGAQIFLPGTPDGTL